MGMSQVPQEETPAPQRYQVTASAYNSLPTQTQGNPNIAAWGDKLKPGMKAIAVSRDLLKKGLSYGMRVKIEGLPGEYRVLDKMHPRWKNKVDIYMGNDKDAALEWGVRKVQIRFTPLDDDVDARTGADSADS